MTGELGKKHAANVATVWIWPKAMDPRCGSNPLSHTSAMIKWDMAKNLLYLLCGLRLISHHSSTVCDWSRANCCRGYCQNTAGHFFVHLLRPSCWLVVTDYINMAWHHRIYRTTMFHWHTVPLNKSRVVWRELQSISDWKHRVLSQVSVGGEPSAAELSVVLVAVVLNTDSVCALFLTIVLAAYKCPKTVPVLFIRWKENWPLVHVWKTRCIF